MKKNTQEVKKKKTQENHEDVFPAFNRTLNLKFINLGELEDEI